MCSLKEIIVGASLIFIGIFLIYIYAVFIQTGALDLYANGSTLHVADVDIKNIQRTLQNYLDIISNWCSFNNMLIHPNICDGHIHNKVTRKTNKNHCSKIFKCIQIHAVIYNVISSYMVMDMNNMCYLRNDY